MIRVLALVLLVVFPGSLCPRSLPNAFADPDPDPAPEPRPDTGTALPPAVLESVKRAAGLGDRQPGTTNAEMANVPRPHYLLQTVEGSFRDANALPGVVRTITDDLRQHRDDLGQLAASAWKRLDVPPELLNPSFVGANMDPTAALAALADHARANGVADPLGDFDQETWRMMPENLQRLAIRLTDACNEALPTVQEAFADGCFRQPPLSGANRDQGIRAVLGLFQASGADTIRTSVRTLARADLTLLGIASVRFAARIQHAITEFQSGDIPPKMRFDPPVRLHMPFGDLVITDSSNRPAADGRVVIDLGGDDHYRSTGSAAPVGCPASRSQPIGLLVELAGNDTYESDSSGFGSACMGICAHIDLAGDDRWSSSGFGAATAIHGMAIAVDYEGDDTYESRAGGFSEACAINGVGLLIDHAGSDTYRSGHHAQGFAATRGMAVLMDCSGNDRYEIRDSDAIRLETLYHGRPLAIAQGCSYGVRSHNLAGGIGGLLDLEGDDRYDSHIWTQGAAYWWGLGFLDDRGGNDTYRAIQYAQGASAHQALGCMVEHAGNDVYNDDRVYQQILGAARDMSIAVFVERGGNDRYTVPYTSAGSGNLNAIGLFCDQSGDDHYRFDGRLTSEESKKTVGFGCAVNRDGRSGTFRDRMPTLGVFIDGGGRDGYDTPDPAIGDGRRWLRRDPDLPLIGYGSDR